jgi:hypothetical protein
MQRNTRARMSDIGSEADNAGDVKGEALYGVPVCRYGSELWAVVAEEAEEAVVQGRLWFKCTNDHLTYICMRMLSDALGQSLK